MPNQIQVKRGAASGLPTLAVGELGFTTDTFRLYSGSGSGNKLVGEPDFVKLSGSTLAGFLTLHADPSNNLHPATKQYVDNLIQGIKAKSSARAATTGNITLSGTQTIDGIALSVSDRVLVKLQTATAENGIYTVAAGSWTRTTDADSWAELVSMFVWIEQGTVHADSGWLCTVDPGGTLGTTAVTFVQFSGAGSIAAGNGLTKTDNTLSVVAHTGISVTANGVAVSYGSSAGTAVQGNDVRVTADQAAGTASIRAIGTGALQACAGNDSRLSDSRTPTAHVLDSASHTVSGLTTGHFLKATGASAFGFAAHGLTASDVGAAPASHAANASTYGYGDATNAGHLRVGTGIGISAGTISVTYGSSANTACQGNDSRLSDARTPTSHTHGNIANAGTIGTTQGLPIITGTGGIVQAGSFGTDAGTFCQGNDSRLHAQHTDTGTTSATFQLQSGSSGPKLKNNTSSVDIKNAADSGYLALRASSLVALTEGVQARIGQEVRCYSAGDVYYGAVKFAGSTASRSFNIPDDSGTALISDASTINGGTW